MVLFAAATGLRPAEWIALEHRDIDRDGRVVYVHRSFTQRPAQATRRRRRASAPCRCRPARSTRSTACRRASRARRCSFPSQRGGYLDLHNFRNRDWKPAQLAAGIDAAPARLRSPAHLRDLRPPCRHLHLRPLPLHGRQPDHDRPPLRPPRPRRTRARDPASSTTLSADEVHGGHWWTLGWTLNQSSRRHPGQRKPTPEQGISEAL